MTTNILRCKLAVLGDATVGKTSLCQMFLQDGQKYPKTYVMTQGVELNRKSIQIPETPYTVELYLYDTSGQTIFKSITTEMVPRTNMVMLVYDVTSMESFKSLTYWNDIIKEMVKEKPLLGVVVGHKIDNPSREVSEQEARAWADINGLEYFETTTQNPSELDAPFNFLADTFYKSYQERVQNLQSGRF